LSKQRGSESDDKEEDEVKKLMISENSESHDRSLNHSNNDLDPITVS
jgi:hypothetical protein